MTSIGIRQDRNALLRQYQPLVRRLANQMLAKLPANVTASDLQQAGLLGLDEALSRFDEAQGVQFETFASVRIRGAMIDELRGADWMSRDNRRSQRDMEAAIQKLGHRLGRAPSQREIAAEMGLSLAEYQEMRSKVYGTQLVYLEDLNGNSEDDDKAYLDRHVSDADANPLNQLQEQRKRAAVVAAIESLSERDRSILSMYYEKDMNLKEIAAVLGVTESRVCQLHSQCISRIRAKVRE